MDKLTFFTEKSEAFMYTLEESFKVQMMRSCNGRPVRMQAQDLLKIAVEVNIHPVELITNHGVGWLQHFRMDQLNELSKAFDGSVLEPVHKAA